jgi:hypothetical protein
MLEWVGLDEAMVARFSFLFFSNKRVVSEQSSAYDGYGWLRTEVRLTSVSDISIWLKTKEWSANRVRLMTDMGGCEQRFDLRLYQIFLSGFKQKVTHL